MRRTALTFALAIALAPLAAAAATPPAPAEFARVADAMLDAAYRPDAPGVAVLVMRGDEVLYRSARGEADVEADVPLTPGDHFRIGSVTKQIAAAGLLKLVEAGKVSLDDPLSKYLPDYPDGAKVTIEQLLNHTSGIRSYTDMPGTMEGPIQRDLTTAQLVDYFKGEAPDFAPGEGWKYNNSGYVLVGAVIEAASGQPWHRYLDEALFQPLGMKDTGYGHDPAVVARQVKGYSTDGKGPAPAKPLSMTQPHAAGALVSTVDDLARWSRALHEGRVLKHDTYTRMITPTGKAAESGYGYGIGTGTVRGTPVLEHGGGIFGFTSHLTYVPGPDITVAVLHNSNVPPPGANPGAVARRMTVAALGDPYPEASPVAVDTALLKQYEGVYRIDADATRTLRVVDGKLTGQRTGGSRSELIPLAQDTFLYPDGFNRFRIERDDAGKVSGMRFWANGEGEGTVARRTDEPLPAEPVAVTLPRESLERVTGVYLANGMEFHITLDGDTLSGQIKGQPQAVPLVATSPTRFTADVVGAELTFAPETGPARAVTLRQGGNTLEFERMASAD
jgi:D-alanyl-D-alanine carboxypeptidase